MNEITQLTISPEIEPVKLYPGEKLKHFQAYELYLKLRSLDKVAKVLGIRNRSIVSVWSGKYNWVERCREVDEAVSKVMAASMLDSQIQSNIKHLEIVDKAIDKWKTKLDNDEVNLSMVQDIEKLINMRNKLSGQSGITDEPAINVNISFK